MNEERLNKTNLVLQLFNLLPYQIFRIKSNYSNKFLLNDKSEPQEYYFDEDCKVWEKTEGGAVFNGSLLTYIINGFYSVVKKE